MSAFFVIHPWDRIPGGDSAAAGMHAALAHRGLDGSRTLAVGATILGHQHFWTTPEELGERQPLEDEEDRFFILFDGRLDNRPELSRELSRSHREVGLSDARLALLAFRRWGEDCFRRFVGPFACVLFDKRSRQLVWARDPLGDRTLFYSYDRQVLLIASEESALLTHPAVSDAPDEITWAHFHAVSWPGNGRTFYQDIKEVLPAHLMKTGAHGEISSHRYWIPQPRLHRSMKDRDWVAEFRGLLEGSVHAQLRALGQAGVMMSGGLDSTSLAALASRECEQLQGTRLKTFSWLFDGLPECDEWEYIREIIQHFPIIPVLIQGENDWPLRDFESWPFSTNQPEANAYRPLKQKLYQTARAHGLRVLLTGAFGDQLYAGSNSWLEDLLGRGRLLEAGLELAQRMRQDGFTSLLRDSGVRKVARNILIGAGRRRSVPGTDPFPWLTAQARQLLSLEAPTRPCFEGCQPDQTRAILSSLAARSAAAEMALANRAGIELRHPFRDLRLVQFMLTVPAHLLGRPSGTKWILREAMKGLLPEPVRKNRKPIGNLSPLYRRGLGEREVARSVRLLQSPKAAWSKYVAPGWMSENYPSLIRRGVDGPAALVPWHCLSGESWRRGIEQWRSEAAATTLPRKDGGQTTGRTRPDPAASERHLRGESPEPKQCEVKPVTKPFRRLYRSPRLTEHGDMRCLTLSGSPGTGDSASFMLEQL